jgi:hypothetical protein
VSTVFSSPTRMSQEFEATADGVLCASAKERARLGTGDGCPMAHCWRNRDRRQGRQPRPLRHVPDGRGRGVATDVRRHPVTDLPAAGTACTGMNSASVKCSKRYRGEVCLSVRAEQRVSALPHSQRRASVAFCSRRTRFAVAPIGQSATLVRKTAGNLVNVG